MNSQKHFVLLMVDDDEDDCILVQDAIEESSSNSNYSLELRCLHSGIELLEYLDKSKGDDPIDTHPDLILLDLNMPKMDGRDVLKKLKSNPDFRSIPVIMFSTSGEKAIVQECYNFGANSFIQKPESFESLTEIIRLVSAYWLRITELPAMHLCLVSSK